MSHPEPLWDEHLWDEREGNGAHLFEDWVADQGDNPATWWTAGGVVPIDEMTTAHIINALAYMEKGGDSHRWPFVTAFARELRLRAKEAMDAEERREAEYVASMERFAAGVRS